ncbi:hypothetical protein QBC37DRAFT_372612 [Rhypophila decipiens]|uniref:Large ribosomal subunit protein uL23m n=1 Tax=Rhypophila decipiens TaxID=261697 RepID=A0AAN7B9D7_9PEZI|nr:hypothetical protein QBC37DRAFT_372612 [Rhypophila decipiens]
MATRAATRVGRNFKRGGKEVYLPNHVITFIRPKPKQPPNLATFVVPLTFNKLDLRDYLFHAYNVKVTGVRSFINEKKPERKNGDGPWYRPRSQKMMIAELVDPFVWPEPPEKSSEARSEFDYDMYERTERERTEMEKKHTNTAKSVIPMRDEQRTPNEVKLLRKSANELLSRKATWTGKALLDEGEGHWVEVEEDVKVPKGKQGAVVEEEEDAKLGSEREAHLKSLNEKDHDVVVEDQQRIPPKKDN